jgi:hypothetical protein
VSRISSQVAVTARGVPTGYSIRTAGTPASVARLTNPRSLLILSAVSQWRSSVPRGAESFREVTADSMTIVAGVPVVAVLSVVANLPMWGDQAVFAVRVDAPVQLFTAVSVYAYARHRREDDPMTE